MYNKYKNILLFGLVVILIACEKNDEILVVNGQYKPASIADLDAVVMLTKEGQITNTSIIKDFLQRQQQVNHFLSDYFLFEKNTVPIDNYSSTLTFDFHENGMVDTYYTDQSTPTKGEIVHRTSSYLDIAGIDSVQTYTGDINNNSNRCATLMEQAVAPVSQKKMYIEDRATGYSVFYRFRPMTRIEIRNGQLYYASTAILVSNNKDEKYGAFCNSALKASGISFNTEIIKQLQTGDTILYQSKRAMLIKQ